MITYAERIRRGDLREPTRGSREWYRWRRTGLATPCDFLSCTDLRLMEIQARALLHLGQTGWLPEEEAK